jgi:hypothetical protein
MEANVASTAAWVGLVPVFDQNDSILGKGESTGRLQSEAEGRSSHRSETTTSSILCAKDRQSSGHLRTPPPCVEHSSPLKFALTTDETITASH